MEKKVTLETLLQSMITPLNSLSGITLQRVRGKIRCATTICCLLLHVTLNTHDCSLHPCIINTSRSVSQSQCEHPSASENETETGI